MISRVSFAYGVVAFLALPSPLLAQSTPFDNSPPSPLSPGMAAAPAAPLSEPMASSAAPLPAPNLPQSSFPPPPENPGPATSAPLRDQGGVSREQNAGSSPDGRTPAVAQLPPLWVNRAVAVVDVLDKEDGAVRRVKVPVGSNATEGRLVMHIGACLTRPPTMTPDAAIFVTVTAQPESNAVQGKTQEAGDPMFRGWLIRSEPGATVVGDAAVTFRLIGCEAG